MSLPLPEHFSGFTLVDVTDCPLTYCLLSISDTFSSSFFADSLASSFSLISSDSFFFSSSIWWTTRVCSFSRVSRFSYACRNSSLVDFKVAFANFNCVVSRSITSSRISLVDILVDPTAAHQCNS